MNLTCIGDVHGLFSRYKTIIKDHPNTIQVGDMGVGFVKETFDGWVWDKNPPYDLMVEGGHRFIRGNHDNPAVCRKHSQCIPDGHVEHGVMFIGGAYSIDQAWRREGIDYWSDEELSYQELQELIDKYEQVKPAVMITHECPDDVADIMMASRGSKKFAVGSRTRQAFQVMRGVHKPKLWVYGHWHFSYDAMIEGTRFVCLAELEVKDFEV